MINNLTKACKRACTDYKDLNMYKLNFVLFFMNELHKFKLDAPFFDEEFIETEEFGPYLQSVKDAYEPYGLFNIPQFGANNIFEED